MAKFRSVIAQVVRSETREVYLYFQADGTFHGKDSASQQLGFVATYFDSSDGSCANDCSGFRGDCDDGVRVTARADWRLHEDGGSMPTRQA